MQRARGWAARASAERPSPAGKGNRCLQLTGGRFARLSVWAVRTERRSLVGLALLLTRCWVTGLEMRARSRHLVELI
jgi:hypothetical protein